MKTLTSRLTPKIQSAAHSAASGARALGGRAARSARRVTRRALEWSPRRSPRAAAGEILKLAALAAFGWYAGRSGFGSWYAGVHAPATVAFWHNAFAPACAVLFPVFAYTNGSLVGFLAARGLNPFAVGLFALPLYAIMFIVTLIVWGVWTLPFYVIVQCAIVVLAVTRPLRRLAVAALTPTAADVAGDIVRDLARTTKK